MNVLGTLVLQLVVLPWLEGLQTPKLKDGDKLENEKGFGGLVLRGLTNTYPKQPEDKKERKTKRRKTSLMLRSDNSENVHEPPLEVAEIVDREDHEELPDFADFPGEEPVLIFSMSPPEVLASKEVFRVDPETEAVQIQTSIKVSTVVTRQSKRRVSTTLSSTTATSRTVLVLKNDVTSAAPIAQITVSTEETSAATLMIIPEMHLTTTMPKPVSPIPFPTPKPVEDGWIRWTPGIKPEGEKGQFNATPQPTKYLLKDDALPDALHLISDLWNDQPVYVTETFYITNKMTRTPTPMPTKAAGPITTTTSTRLKKFEKRNKPTTTSRFYLNTALFIDNNEFSIAPDDLYRGIHAKCNAATKPGLHMAISIVLAGIALVFVL